MCLLKKLIRLWSVSARFVKGAKSASGLPFNFRYFYPEKTWQMLQIFRFAWTSEVGTSCAPTNVGPGQSSDGFIKTEKGSSRVNGYMLWFGLLHSCGQAGCQAGGRSTRISCSFAFYFPNESNTNIMKENKHLHTTFIGDAAKGGEIRAKWNKTKIIFDIYCLVGHTILTEILHTTYGASANAIALYFYTRYLLTKQIKFNNKNQFDTRNSD